MKDSTQSFRYVEVRGARYLRAEDVAAFVQGLGAGEETDVRNRLVGAAQRIMVVR